MTPSRPPNPSRRPTQSYKSSASRSASKPAAPPILRPKTAAKPVTYNKAKHRLRSLLIFLLVAGPFILVAAIKQQWFQAPEPGPGFVVLDRVISGLSDDMKAQITLAIETPDQASADIVKLYSPKLRSLLFLTAARFESKELLTPLGKEQLADTLTAVFKKNVDGDRADLILGVHYMEFIIAN